MPSSAGDTGCSGRSTHGKRVSFDLMEQIIEEGTPLKGAQQHWQLPGKLQSAAPGGGSASAIGSKASCGAPQQKGAQQGPGSKGGSTDGGGRQQTGEDLEAGDLYARCRSWLSDHLHFPVVPIYSDVGTGTWWEVTWILLAIMGSPIVFVAIPYAFAGLTWRACLPVLALVTASHYYSALLMCELHTWNVVIRHTRYRDLAKSIWGMRGWHLVFVLQQLGVLFGAIPVSLAAAITMKNVYVAFHPAGNVPIGWWLFVWASIQLVLSQLPTMRHLRHLTFAAALALGFWTVLVVVECFQTGRSTGTGPVSYTPVYESAGRSVLKAFESVSIFSFALANILMPEIQSIVKPPAVSNNKKGFTVAFAALFVVFALVGCAGYWAFGNQAGPVFVLSLPHQRNWKPVTLQIIMVAHVSLEYQLWARPTYEILDYLLVDYFTTDLSQINLMSPKNCLARLCGTGVFVMTTAYLAALLPAGLADMSSIVGAICYIPLDLVIPMLLHNRAKHPPQWRRIFHCVASAIWMLVAGGAITASIYHLCANPGVLQFWADVPVGSQAT